MTERANLRQDIQALRGIAVLLVLLFHAQLGGLAAGYLGVDIFFVLSGYLITGLVNRRLAEDRFSFVGFYIDRAKRLLPAAYVVYVATAIATYWFLTASEFDRFLKTLWGALTFTANIVLWTGTNYFAPSAKFNALLHVWSLSIEEQFYFLLPLALFFTPARNRLALLVIGGAVSWALCLYLTPKSPVAAFFLLPTRAWELALGGALALTEARQQALGLMTHVPSKLSYGLGTGALVAVLLIPTFAPGTLLLGSRHPGIDATLVCLATAVLLTTRFVPLERGAIAWVLARIGDISYSLYLVHWPLFAFATNAYVGERAPLAVRIVLLLFSIVLAFLVFRCFEEPMRRRSYGDSRLRPARIATAATVFVVITAVGVGQARFNTQAMNFVPRSANFGLHSRCEFIDKFILFEECASSAAPDTLLWGDSFAMHLAPGLAASYNGGLWQATKSACGPIIGVAPFRPAFAYTNDWARSCLAFNQSVLDVLLVERGVKRVVMASPFSQFVEEGALGLVAEVDGRVIERTILRQDIILHFQMTIQKLQALGKEVVIVGPSPATGFDIGLCHERKLVGLVLLGPNQDCRLHSEAARSYRFPVDSILQEVAATTAVVLVNLAEYLCDSYVCRTEIEGVPLYWDAGHFSTAGSVKVIAATGAGAAILGRHKDRGLGGAEKSIPSRD